jgi:hypothetical protein
MMRVATLILSALALALLAFDLVLGPGFWGIFLVIPIALLPFPIMSALLAIRIPGNRVGFLLGLCGFLSQVSVAANGYAWIALVRDPGRWPAGELVAVLSNAAFPPALGCAAMLLLYFPNGRGLGGRWTWIERLLVAEVVIGSVGLLFKDVPIQINGPATEGGPQTLITNPLVFSGPVGGFLSLLSHLMDNATAPLILAGPISLFVRYRRSSETTREQIKWLAYGGAISFTIIVASNLAPGDLANWLWVGGIVSLGLLPIAIALAIFRYRLYDIDVLIRRTLIYTALSAVLVAVYVGGVAVFEALLSPLTGGSGVAVAISTLGVVALFQPVRRRIRGAVDRRFYRANYDAERTLDAFAGRLRDQVELDSVRTELLAAVGETLHPSHASVWLREAKS